jgi:hypothetical protein
LRRLAVIARERHGRASVWIPSCVPCGAPMQFTELKLPPPKSAGGIWFPTIEVLT